MIVRMSGPKVLKARYRRDDCLQCDAVVYWAATMAASSVGRVSRAVEPPSMMLVADRNNGQSNRSARKRNRFWRIRGARRRKTNWRIGPVELAK